MSEHRTSATIYLPCRQQHAFEVSGDYCGGLKNAILLRDGIRNAATNHTVLHTLTRMSEDHASGVHVRGFRIGTVILECSPRLRRHRISLRAFMLSRDCAREISLMDLDYHGKSTHVQVHVCVTRVCTGQDRKGEYRQFRKIVTETRQERMSERPKC